MPQFPTLCPTDDHLAKWIEFFANEDDSQWEIIASKNSIINKAVDRLEIISQNQENRWDYEIRQKALKEDVQKVISKPPTNPMDNFDCSQKWK